jgi:cytochrome c-type biogenesis protein CcmH/NrfG
MLDQGNADAFVGMAVGYLHLGEYRLAREALKEAGRLAPQKKEEIDRVLAWLSDQPEAPRP